MDTMLVAGYIAARSGHVTHDERLRLQQLLYYVQCWSLAWTGRPLIDDGFEAWREGPVVRRVYEKAPRPVDELPPTAQSLVDAIIAHYGDMSADELSERAHAETPWREARVGLPAEAPSDRPISTATMRRYFVEQSLAGSSGPRRPADGPEQADQAEVRTINQAARKRWREALDQLAER